MTFLQPEILYGLPLLLVPIIIHLLNRRRYRIEEWGAMQFLIQATRASTSRAKLKQILILAMRTLVVAMLVMFLARPLAGGWVGKLGGGKPDTIFVVIDRSASMEVDGGTGGKSLRERAVESLEEAFQLFKGDSQLVFVDSVGGDLIPMDSFESIKLDWMSEVTHTTTSMPLIMLQVYDWIQKNSVGISEVWIASDLQVSNWQLGDDVWEDIQDKIAGLSQKVSIKVLAMDGRTESNTAVVSNGAIDPGFGFTETIPLRFSFFQNRGGEKELPVEIQVPDASFQTKVKIDGPSTLWRETLSVGEGSSVPWVSLSIPDDANATDNNYFLIVPPAVKPRVVIMAENSELGEIIEAAVTVGVPVGSSIDIISTLEEMPEGDTAMIIWQGAIPGDAESHVMNDFVTSGGSILYLPSGDERVIERQIFDSRWGQLESAEDQKFFTISNWDQQSGPVARTAEGFSLPLDRNSFYKRRELISSGSPVVSFSDEAPFLVMTRNGKGRTYWMTTLPEREWSTLGQGFAFVPMLQRMLLEASSRFIKPVQIEAGRFFLDENSEDSAQWSIVHPVAPGSDPRLHAGIYRSGDRYIAVNPPMEEYEMEYYSLEDIEPRLAEISVTVVDGGTVGGIGNDDSSGSDLQSELWKFFLIGMVIFLGVESFLTLPVRISDGAEEVSAT